MYLKSHKTKVQILLQETNLNRNDWMQGIIFASVALNSWSPNSITFHSGNLVYICIRVFHGASLIQHTSLDVLGWHPLALSPEAISWRTAGFDIGMPHHTKVDRKSTV